jgi:hypothetical protein
MSRPDRAGRGAHQRGQDLVASRLSFFQVSSVRGAREEWREAKLVPYGNFSSKKRWPAATCSLKSPVNKVILANFELL